MNFVPKILMLCCLAMAYAFAMEESIKPRSGILTLINRTGSTLELHTEKLQQRSEGGLNVLKKTELIGKGQDYKLSLENLDKASLSYRTTYLGKKIVPIVLKEIKSETQGRSATLLIQSGGLTGSDIIIDLEKNLKIIEAPTEGARSDEKESQKSELKELILRNDALMNIFVRYATIFEVSPQVFKGESVHTRPTEGMTTTWISENKELKIPLVTITPQGDLIKTLRVTKIEVAPAYATDEENRSYQESATLSGAIELPLERIKRKGSGHTAVVVPITRESGLFSKSLKVDIDRLEIK